MKLYSFFRSSAAYRVRIALNLKSLDYEYAPVHLRRGGGEQFADAYRRLNPQSLVPTLVEGGHALAQSLAIIEYLEETHAEPPLLPRAAADRAYVRALAQIVACEIHPLNNTRVLGYLSSELGVSDEARTRWYQHWVALGLEAFETRVAHDARTGRFCFGDTPGIADCCLVPQLANARRFECDLSGYPALVRIERACNELPAFQQAAPGRQPDAEA